MPTSARLAFLILACTALACASAPPAVTTTGDGVLRVNNPLEVPVRVYEMYQLRPVFDAHVGSARCIPLGDVAPRDSAEFTIIAGVDGPIGVVFQADSLNGIPADVSRPMQAQAGQRLYFTVNRVLRIATPWVNRGMTRGTIGSQVGEGTGDRAIERC